MTGRVRPDGILLILGLVLVVSALVYAFVLPQTPVRMARASASLTDVSAVWSWFTSLPWPVPTDGAVIAGVIVVFGGLAVGAYAGAVALVWGRPATRRLLLAILLPAAIALGVSAVALPTQSSDIIDYLLSGRVAVLHGASPYDVAPDAFRDDPLLPYASGTYTADPEAKPPVWIGGAIGAAALTAGSSPADAVLVTRVLFLLATIANLGLIALTLRRWRPEHVVAGLTVYAWSPIVILHGQAKFDTVMATFALLAALALVQARPLASLTALWLSVMVKLLTLGLVAVSVLGDVVARRWRRVVLDGAVIAVVTVLLYLPFSGGPLRAVDHLFAAAGSGASLPTPLNELVLVVAGLAVLWAGVRSRGEIEGTIQGWAVAGLAVIPLSLLGSSWYLIMPTAVVSLAGERWKTGVLVAASGLAFLIDTWTRTSNATYKLPVPFGLSRSSVVILVVVVLFIGTVVAGWFVNRRRRLQAARAAIKAVDPASRVALP